jgi:tetratricopeptide (TPR) repeat protein
VTSINRTFGLVVFSVAISGVFLSLTGCGTDMLTYAQDAKHAGIGQYNDGNYADAAGSFRNAVRQDPTDPETEYWLGLSYEKTGSYHEAINAYKTALILLPEPGTAHYSQQLHDKAFDRLAYVVAKDDPTNTETDLLVQTASDQKSAEQYWLLGRVFRYRGDPDTAMDDYHRSIQINPDNFAIQKELGLYLEQLGQIQEASAVLRDAYRLNQYNDDVNAALLRVGMTPGPGLLSQDTVRTLPPSTPAVDPSLSTPAAHIDPPVDDPQTPRD